MRWASIAFWVLFLVTVWGICVFAIIEAAAWIADLDRRANKARTNYLKGRFVRKVDGDAD